jgi:2-oxoglutarate ferredoxin oxidoreductase subunit beta
MSVFIDTDVLPFCKGCGHHHVARNTAVALEKSGLHPLDVVLITDIGCHAIVDDSFTTHTAHGLHGRSVALGVGMAMALPKGKKVIVYIGDGGATIGLQHILEAAHLNIDLTVVVHNNMLYGMTGGQPSGLTPCGFRTTITPRGNPLTHHDLCRLARDAGAAFTARVIGTGDFSDSIHQALETPGFALVEVLELCTSYGTKMNSHLRLGELAEQEGYPLGAWIGPERPAFRLEKQDQPTSLLDPCGIPIRYTAHLEQPVAIVLGGSAGEGVQSAAELFARAAMTCGLQVAKKGSYPVTVQVGFSTADILISPHPILCHAIEQPNAVLITSADGLENNLRRIEGMDQGTVWLDSSLQAPKTGAELHQHDFRKKAGSRNAALYALLCFVRESHVIPLQAFIETIRDSPHSKRMPVDLLKDFLVP